MAATHSQRSGRQYEVEAAPAMADSIGWSGWLALFAIFVVAVALVANV